MQKTNQVQNNLNQISQLINQGQLQQAKSLCLDSLTVFPENKKLLLKLSWIYEIMGDFNAGKFILENLREKYTQDLSILDNLIRFYLRNHIFSAVQEILDIFNKINHHTPWAIKLTKKVNILFNNAIRNYQVNIILIESYIKDYPDDSFGYTYQIESVVKHLSDNSTQKLQALEKQIKKQNLPIFIQKKCLRQQQRFFSLLDLNNCEISQEKSRLLLIERLNLLLNFKKYDQEIAKIIKELFSQPLTKTELGGLWWNCIKYEPLESRLIEYIAKNPQWLDYSLNPNIQQQIKIIKQCRQLKNQVLLNQSSQFPYPIDVVFAWCDLNDPNFRTKFKRQNGFDPVESQNDSHFQYRFINNNEIKLALISLFKYFSEVNHVYIVTNNQQFNLDFLNIQNQQKITFIDHDDFILRQYVKGEVFNSNVIEAFLWNIPNLTEHFIYFNDDQIIGNYLKPGHLFTENNQALAFLKPRNANLYNGELTTLVRYNQGSNIPSMISRENAWQDFKQKNNLEPYLTDIHQGVLLLKSESKKAFYKYQDLWSKSFFTELIRGANSVYPILIYLWEAILSGKQQLCNYHKYVRHSITFNGGLNQEKIKYIKEVKPLFYCVNQIPDRESQKYLNQLISDLLVEKNNNNYDSN